MRAKLEMVKKHLREDMKMFEHEKQEDKKLIKKIGKPMKRQSASSRLDESLGMRRGKESTKKQTMKDRRDESRELKDYKKAHGHMKKAMDIISKHTGAEKKEAAAGRAYNKSAKHRKAESAGMKKAMARKYG